ncbi:MAG: Transcriptional regulator, PadR family, partial [uncultured Rubrobacteraceae bacterium]
GGGTRTAGVAAANAGGVADTAGARGRGAARVWDHAGGRGADGWGDAARPRDVVRFDQADAGRRAYRGVRRAPRPWNGRPAAALLPDHRLRGEGRGRGGRAARRVGQHGGGKEASQASVGVAGGGV